MRKLKKTLLIFVAVIFTACGAGASTWQDHYDLGMRYLSEGNYEEAILSFTVAIEIDPKRADAYIGRGDAYTASAKYTAAEEDYLFVLDMNKMNSEIYLKLADMYIAKGDKDAAIEILLKGYEVTENSELQERLRKLGINYFKDLNAQFIANVKTYQEEIAQKYAEEGTGFSLYGVRFSPAVSVEFKGKIESVEEAGLWNDCEVPLDNDSDENFEYNWEYFDKKVQVSGYFEYDENYAREFYDEEGYLILEPNGPYLFHVLEYHFENEELNE